jgi:endonuclease/exonuclease/phosphatase (EEP) superfamily protein YafD
MPTYTLRCKCGEEYHADEQSLGRRIACRRCGRVVDLRRSDPSLVVLHEAEETTAHRRRRRRRTRRSRAERAIEGGERARAWVQEQVRRVAPPPPPAPTSRRKRRRSPVAKAVGWAVWGYLAAACLVALVMWGTGDEWWPGTVLLFVGRWIFLLPLALLVPAALVVRRRLLVPLLLAALVVAGPVMGARTGWRRYLQGAPAGPRLRVVSFNAGLGTAMAPDLWLFVEEWKADVVALQECGEALALATRSLAGWYHHDDERGLCLLSRYPIREVKSMDRGALQRVRETGAGIGGAGFVTRYVLDTPRGPLRLVNLHLETPRKGLEALIGGGDLQRLRDNTELRDIESGLASRWARQGATPSLVVAGDFNTPAESRIFRRHWGDFADAFSHVGVGLGATRYNGWIRVRIDHVLTGPAWRPVAATVGRDVGSDHRPLIVDLAYTGQ